MITLEICCGHIVCDPGEAGRAAMLPLAEALGLPLMQPRSAGMPRVLLTLSDTEEKRLISDGRLSVNQVRELRDESALVVDRRINAPMDPEVARWFQKHVEAVTTRAIRDVIEKDGSR